MDQISVLVFSWNTQSLKLFESLNDQEERGYWRNNCHPMDFWESLETRIINQKPTLVVISFQEDIQPGSYAHSHFFPQQMKNLGYSILEQCELMGVGKTTFDGLMKADLFFRGLRMSVFVRTSDLRRITLASPTREYAPSFFRNKGALGVYCQVQGQNLLLINTHLPFDSESLREAKEKQDLLIRQDALNAQNEFFNTVYRKFITESPIPLDHVIMMGDLNYRIHPFHEWSAIKTGQKILELIQQQEYTKIQDQDEFYQQLKRGNIYHMLEGVNGQGPTFEPTCKMRKGRGPGTDISSYSFGKADFRVPSYCDRILHQSFGDQLICQEYFRLDEKTIQYSDHSAVGAVFQLPILDLLK